MNFLLAVLGILIYIFVVYYVFGKVLDWRERMRK